MIPVVRLLKPKQKTAEKRNTYETETSDCSAAGAVYDFLSRSLRPAQRSRQRCAGERSPCRRRHPRACTVRRTDSGAGRDTGADTDAHTDADAHTNSDTHADTCAHTDTRTHTGTDTHALESPGCHEESDR